MSPGFLSKISSRVPLAIDSAITFSNFVGNSFGMRNFFVTFLRKSIFLGKVVETQKKEIAGRNLKAEIFKVMA